MEDTLEMGLLTILKKLKEKEKEMRILVIGLDNAGKTTILKRLMGEDVSITTPTFGFNIKTLAYRGYKLNIWDVGGQLMLRSYWKNYFEETDGVIWVVDSTDVERFENCRKELQSLLVEERLISSTLAILANKQDLNDAVSIQTIHDALQLDKIRGHHWRCFPCSGLTGDNLVEGIDWLVNDIASRVFTLE
ncbi:ADP ribosylation factor protein 2 like [Trichuris trichiura]|uniref:ADP-ribosylation factor-like protein 2 n=1 Tax=Trichuris trichiura TaxID=36087 RepID=A0A077Z4L4_TRITR|nr:ADP ribosylation factor protein 2 like [Trichuris trichiura]